MRRHAAMHARLPLICRRPACLIGHHPLPGGLPGLRWRAAARPADRQESDVQQGVAVTAGAAAAAGAAGAWAGGGERAGGWAAKVPRRVLGAGQVQVALATVGHSRAQEGALRVSESELLALVDSVDCVDCGRVSADAGEGGARGQGPTATKGAWWTVGCWPEVEKLIGKRQARGR